MRKHLPSLGLHALGQHLMAERDRLVLWIPVFMGLGSGVYFSLPAEPPLPLVAAVFGLSILLAALCLQKPLPRLGSLAFMLSALGFLVGSIHTYYAKAPALTWPVFYKSVEGRIEDIQDKEKGTQRLLLNSLVIEDIPPERTPDKILLSFREATKTLRVGDRIRVRAMLFSPPEPSMPGAHDFARSYYYNRIGATGYTTYKPQLIEHTGAGDFVEWLTRLRLTINERITAPMQKDTGPVAAAMMVGVTAGVSEAVATVMRNAGIFHVISISGLHMSIAVAVVYMTLRFLLSLVPAVSLRLPVKKIAAGLSLLGAFCYLLLAGYPVPAIRSFIMVGCVLVAILCHRRGISLYSLAWSAIIILLWQPDAILGASFQLSYAATAFMLAFYERWGYKLQNSQATILRKIYLYFAGLMLTSLMASLATTPLVIYHFNRFTLWSILANMLLMPLTSFWIMPTAVLSFLAMPVGLESWPLELLDHGLKLMLLGAAYFADLPFASVSMPSPTFGGLLLCIFGGLWLCLWQKRWRWLGVPLIAAGLSTTAYHRPYEILINDEGTLVAWRLTDDRMIFVLGNHDSYEGQQWLRSNGGLEGGTFKKPYVRDPKKPPTKTKKKVKPTDPTQALPISCNYYRCVFATAGLRVAVARRDKDTKGICTKDVDVVISQGSLAQVPECKQVHWLIDKTFLRRSGATGIRLHEGKPQLITTQQVRGKRPWTSYSPLYQTTNPSMMLEPPPKEEKNDQRRDHAPSRRKPAKTS